MAKQCMCLLVQVKILQLCLHPQARKSGQNYFHFSYWPGLDTLLRLRCWLTSILSPPLPPTCPWL